MCLCLNPKNNNKIYGKLRVKGHIETLVTIDAFMSIIVILLIVITTRSSPKVLTSTI